jgi:hypothetical protein
LLSYLATGKLFNHWQWTAPLAIGDDDLDASHGNDGGNHANTHIPEIIGSARGYEVTGNVTQRAIATNFFEIARGLCGFWGVFFIHFCFIFLLDSCVNILLEQQTPT